MSSDSAGLGIGGCGTASQTQTVTGVAAQTLTFFLYVCTEASGTLTAELRPSGSTTSVATASRRLSVVPSPDEAPADARGARGAARNVARAGTPGIVSGIHFDRISTTSFRAKWSRPSNGGQSLRGYGILLWTGDVENDKPGYGEATTITTWETLVEDRIEKQAKTFTGLSDGTTHHYLMHACNPNGCGHWSYPAKQVTTSVAPTAAPTTSPVPAPHRPHTIMFSEISPSSVRVRWSAAANTGGVPLTGFEMKYWPYDAANPNSETGAQTANADDGDDRSEPVTGLAANTEYELKMRACNRPNNTNCSPWSADHRFTTTAGTGAPGPVKNLDVDPGNRQLVVSWEAPDSDGGTAITGYEVGYKKRISSSWQSWTHSGTGTTATITDRLNGTLYDVRVRACNHGVSETARCSQSWRYASGTPEAPRPRNLDVVPRAGRKAVLTWGLVAGAARYQVQAQIQGQADWHDARCEAATNGQPTQPKCVIDLEYIARPGGNLAGLHTHKAFALQVRALRPQTSAYSEPVVIIDTPIFRAKGASTRVEISWRPVGAHSHINAGGRYQLRDRRFLGDHRSVNWNAETAGFTPTRPTSLLPVGTSSHPIGSLVNYELYAIQLLYNAPQPNAAAIKVFAARDAYAWPSDRAASGGERVGTFPLSKPVSNQTYEYYICSDTFPQDMEPDEPDDPEPEDGIRVKSRAFIQAAMGQWQSATTTGPGTSLVTMKYMGTTCADYSRYIQPIVNTINTYVSISEEDEDAVPEVRIETHVRHVIQGFGSLTSLLNQDKERSEVIFVDLPTEERGPLESGYRLTMRYVYFEEVSDEIGLSKCVFGAEACAADEEINGVRTTDILLNGTMFEKTADFNWDIPDVAFNSCLGDSNARNSRYAVLVHEAAHALGIRGATLRSGGSGQQIHHSQVLDSTVKSVAISGDDLCSPTPFDVMAIYALYQAEG